MIKKHLIFDLDWTLIESMSDTIKIALNYLKKIANTDIQKAEYILNTSWGMSLREQLVIIYDWVDNINIDEIKNWIYNILFKNEAAFFVWIPEKIIELSKNYKLFLTTWNSTPTAIKYLTNWWIIDCFELLGIVFSMISTSIIFIISIFFYTFEHLHLCTQSAVLLQGKHYR